jgi:hypothetical protein
LGLARRAFCFGHAGILHPMKNKSIFFLCKYHVMIFLGI